MPTSAPEDLRRVIEEQNPWWRLGQVPRPLALPVERSLARHLWRRLLDDDPDRYQLILGPRRVGKTTVLYQTVSRLLGKGVDPSRIWWLRLDHPVLLREDLGDLVRLAVESCESAPDNPVFLMLDELVYADSWDTWLKTFYDEQWPVQIAATSSAAAALHRGRLESGVGRWEEQHLAPYSFTEFLDFVAAPPGVADGNDGGARWRGEAEATLADTIAAMPSGPSGCDVFSNERRRLMMVGGFPELLRFAGEASHQADDGYEHSEAELLLLSQQVLRPDAVERAVYKDIPQSFGVDNPMMLERLLYVLADQISSLLSPTNISSDLGLAVPTVERYLTYLDQAFLIFTLPNYSGTEVGVQRRGRKLYFIDAAVRNAALQRGIAPLEDSREMGMLLENLVASSMRSLAVQSGVRLHHWREGKHEIDLVYDDPRSPLAFEVASSPRHDRAGLAAFIDRHRRFYGNSYLVAPNASVISAQTSASGIGTLPVDALLIAVGAQAHRDMMNRLRIDS